MFFEGPGKPNEGPRRRRKGKGADSAAVGARVCPSLGKRSRRKGHRRAEVSRKPGRSLGPGGWRWGWSPGPQRAEHGEGKPSLGCSRPVLTGRPLQGPLPSPPRPAQPEGGAAQPQRTFCLSFFWLSDSSKGASSSMMSPQRSFPGITGRRHLPPGAVATTTYGHRQRERKRGQGGRRPGPCVTSGPRTAPREQSSPNSPGGNASRKPQPASANENAERPR